MKRSDIFNAVSNIFPKYKYNLMEKNLNNYSEIYIFHIKKDEKNKKILVKKYKEENKDDVTREANYQNKFYEANLGPSLINCPKVFGVDEENNLLVMEYIEAKSLKKLLMKSFFKNKNQIYEVIKTSSKSLATFHKIFSLNNSRQRLNDKKFFNNYLLRNEVSFSKKFLKKCNFNLLSNAFIDFAPWNILIKNKKIYLIDFPGMDCIATPHLDLAHFKFRLRIIKQYPQFRILKFDWWDIESLFKFFLNEYCKEIGTKLNRFDKSLIYKLEKEYAIKLRERYEEKAFSLKDKLEKYYLRNILDDLTD